MKNNHTSYTIMGEVASVNANGASFSLTLLTGEEISVIIAKSTSYEVLRNVGDEQRDRVEDPDESYVISQIGPREEAEDVEMWDAKKQLIKYIKPGIMLCMLGVVSTNSEPVTVYNARRVILMHSEPGVYGWESTHWWIQQINTLFEQWLDVLFGTKRKFNENDFAENYRTNLDLLGGVTANEMQECATMSRFLYGLSSSYMLTGNDRALSAAKACSRYLVNAFSSPSHDGEHVFWKFGRVIEGKSTKDIIGSLNPDDKGTFALYEQIYALSGLTQYYRATQDTWILGYIVKTITAFQQYYLDEFRDGDPCYTGLGGYFSHIDPVTMRPDSPSLQNIDGDPLKDNKEKKNWNSVGDHIPAYLINLLVSIDPLPVSEETEAWSELKVMCVKILDECVTNILEHFKPTDGSKLVYERFHKDWTFDSTWGWQQDRGIVGHNLKISWNLTRCGHYYTKLAKEYQEGGDDVMQLKYENMASRCYGFSREIGHDMREVGIDQIRGGIFDALERHPNEGTVTEFAWSSTKDFWQQEQAILAYYIMQGIGGDGSEKADFLQLARYCSAFWNLFFVDQDNRKIYFRTTESGEPVIQGQYGIQSGHAIAGYHAFELNYLAHIYIRTYVDRGEKENESFVLYYKPEKNTGIASLNVLPDFFREEDLKIVNVKINGLSIPIENQHHFQIDISGLPENSVILVEYLPTGLVQAPSYDNIKSARYESVAFKQLIEPALA